MYNIFQSLDWPNLDNRADDLDIMTTMMILCFMDAANGIAVVTMLLSKIPLSESCNCGSFPGALSNCSLS